MDSESVFKSSAFLLSFGVTKKNFVKKKSMDCCFSDLFEHKHKYKKYIYCNH